MIYDKSNHKRCGVELKNVSITYRNGCCALEKVSFFIPENTITALIGMNGAGKSTLFKAIMGFIPLEEGSISVFDHTVEEAIKENMVAYIPQVESIDWSFPILVEDIVMMGRYKHMNWLRIPSSEDHHIVTEALESVGMAFMRKRQIGELSIGQQKRVFIARALATKGRIIILDEPFAAIDFKTEREIISLLKELRNANSMILVSTHNINSVPMFCDLTIFLKKRVIAYGKTSDVFISSNIQETFGDTINIKSDDDHKLYIAENG
ncbi:metal ABC transporter ATP-binding protein [Candidatus Liberibacter americanus]|uniref:ABC-type Mn/Zn transport system, ATPase component protein n=1 Tax=Candidatus Liberibacter americanus str. Sao Paulo TaxID=1261131 RepID=U6B5H7_9HYPH|nr:ATP-binding cassette domain-containing protein [Candidatus Liberibacter americanus]AHA28230.1 ABC-type Mn/Zn transport system, ATPase component protein [Candidatus Liberibacter americanus str. Sao Paulo]EMS36256.1 ABC transporter nucleotide binding/ATPase protein (iron) [Candidatus Liberibacter americanus PW_SP]